MFSIVSKIHCFQLLLNSLSLLSRERVRHDRNRGLCHFHGLIKFSLCVAGLFGCMRMAENRQEWKSHMCEPPNEMEGRRLLKNTFHHSTVMASLFHFAEHLSHQSAIK